MRLILIGMGGVLLCAACSDEAPAAGGAAPTSDSLETAPPAPAEGVVIAADPPPPFAYWAPAGSIIRNHPTSRGIWFAEVDGEAGPTYFGDDCGASRFQGLVGRSDVAGDQLSAPAGVRGYARGDVLTADLRPDRLNIERETSGGIIRAVACG